MRLENDGQFEDLLTPPPTEVTLGTSVAPDSLDGHAVEAQDARVEANNSSWLDRAKQKFRTISQATVLAIAAVIGSTAAVGGTGAAVSSCANDDTHMTDSLNDTKPETAEIQELLIASLKMDKKTAEIQGKIDHDILLHITSLDNPQEEFMLMAEVNDDNTFSVNGAFSDKLNIGYKYQALDPDTNEPIQGDSKFFHPTGEVRVDVLNRNK